MSDAQKEKTSGSAIGGGATAASSGTLIIMIANSLPQDSLYKIALLHAAPTITVIIGAIATYLISWVKQHLARRELEDAVSDAKSYMVEMLKNPETSDGHKNNIRQKLEQLESVTVESKLSAVKKFADGSKITNY
ncbi:hypothetical protein ACFOJE_14020 [Azotobacter bryophylli]|uniref:Holin n=1 Tax=Azotobacter bryophylli TaxID=1986537 RepID=A0ABV7AV94_9GAMM